MATSRDTGFDAASLDTLHWVALVLVVATGVLHLYAGYAESRIPVALAGVGFLGAAVLFLQNYRRRLLYLVGILYTAIQIPLWYAANAPDFTLVGYADKAIQVVLIVVLAFLYWRER